MLPLLFNNPLISIIFIDSAKIKPPLKTKHRQAHLTKENFQIKSEELENETAGQVTTALYWFSDKKYTVEQGVYTCLQQIPIAMSWNISCRHIYLVDMDVIADFLFPVKNWIVHRFLMFWILLHAAHQCNTYLPIHSWRKSTTYQKTTECIL